MRHSPPWPLLGLTLALASACTPRHDSDSYFPLSRGDRWVYSMVTQREGGGTEQDSLVMHAEGSSSFEGATAYRRRSDSGVDYWLRSDASGIYRVASKTDFDEAPQRDPQPRYVLKQPLVPGTTWQATTTAYVLRRQQEFPPEVRYTHAPVMMSYVIEGTGDTVETPAGKFGPCLRVKGTASLRMFADPVSGWADLPLITTEWYCKAVGLVKLVREEPARSAFLVGGKVSLLLTSWETH